MPIRSALGGAQATIAPNIWPWRALDVSGICNECICMRHYSALEATGGFLSEERVQEQALFNVEAIAHLLLVVVVVFVAACTPYRVPAHLIDPIDLTSQQDGRRRCASLALPRQAPAPPQIRSKKGKHWTDGR